MKVLLVSKDCQIGGVETMMVAEAEGLQAVAVECELFFFERGPMLEQIPPTVRAHVGDLADLLEIVKSRNIDVVHGQSSDWYCGISAVREVGAKLVVTSGHDWIVPAWNSMNCDAFVGVSKWLSEVQQPLTDLPVRTVYNGIDTHKFKPALVPEPSDPKPILAWVGRGPDLRAKRIDKLAAASHQIRDAGIRIWLAEPHGFEKVAAVAPEAARSLRETAEVWKGIERGDMPDFFRQVAQSGGAILSTSFSEGLPVALTEAQACGCPAIGTDVKGVNESVRPEHGGVLIPFDSPAERLAEIVIDTLLDSERRKWRREASAKFARENFSAEDMVRGYLSIFREVLETPRAESVFARLRYWSSPVLEWRNYIETRWSVGQSQFETSQNLAVRGEWELAAAAARASARTCPTLYLNRKRFMHLSSVFSHGQNAAAG